MKFKAIDFCYHAQLGNSQIAEADMAMSAFLWFKFPARERAKAAKGFDATRQQLDAEMRFRRYAGWFE